jgi:t-SNARE complex subunit (syntaxin)
LSIDFFHKISNSLERFKKIMNLYYVIQSDHRENCKGRIKRQMDIADMKTSDEDLEKMLESGNPQIFTQQVLQMLKIINSH